MSKENYYVYRFINLKNEIIYVGRTNNIKNRMSQHFGKEGHLAKECYDDVFMIQYATFKNQNDMRMFEIYYITKHKPIWNTEFNCEDNMTIFDIPEPEWIMYKIVDSDEYKSYLNLIGKLEKSELTQTKEAAINFLKEFEVMAFRSNSPLHGIKNKLKELKKFKFCIDGLIDNVEQVIEEYVYMIDVAIETEKNIENCEERITYLQEKKEKLLFNEDYMCIWRERRSGDEFIKVEA